MSSDDQENGEPISPGGPPSAADVAAPPEQPAGGTPGLAFRTIKNSGYAVAEFAWPIVLALLITPRIVRGLGSEAYGVLSVVSVTVGLFGLLDLGIGGAAIREVAGSFERRDTEHAGRVMGTVLTMYLLIGTLGGLALAALTPLLVTRVIAVPADLQPTAAFVFYVSALAFAVNLVASALGSVMKAAQRFDLSTKVSVVFATVGPVAMLAAVLGGYGLRGVVLASLAVGSAAALVNYFVSARLLGGARYRLGLDLGLLRGLAGFGGWFLLSSIGVVILYQMDKLLVGAFIGVAAVTFYVVPGNLANRIQGFLAASSVVAFPASSALVESGRRDALERLYRDGTRLQFLFALTLAVPMAVFAKPFLTYWMGAEFGEKSAIVMVLLVATYTLLGLTGIPWNLAFGTGRARVNAFFALGMGVLDVALFLLLVGPYGIVGAAVAYLIAALIGAPLLILYVERRVLGLGGFTHLAQYARVLPAVALQAVLAFLLAAVVGDLLTTLAAMAVTAALLPVLYFALRLATDDDRDLLRQVLARLKRRS